MSRIPRSVVVALVLLAFAFVPLALDATGVARPAPALAPRSDPPPSLLTVWGGSGSNLFYQPMGVAVDDHGDVYVTDPNWDRVSKFSYNGKLIKTWGTHGSGDGQFDYPYGIAYSEGNAADPAPYLYVVDADNCRVEKFTPEGLFVDAFGSRGSAQGQLQSPGAIAVGPSGDVYVTDFTNRCVEVFDAKGASHGRFSSVVRGNRAEHLMSPRGIAVAPSGTVYVADDPRPGSGGPGVVDLFTADGTFLSEWTSFEAGGAAINPFGIALDKDGNVSVINDDFVSAPRVLKFTSGGEPLTQWSLAVTGEHELARSLFVAIASSGDVYVTDWANVTVKRYGTAAPTPDTVAPVTTVSGVDKKWHNTPVTLTYTATDNAGGSGVAYTESHIQDWLSPLWSDWVQGSTYVVPASADHSDDGDRSVEFRSVDAAGNMEKKHRVLVLIDTRAPRVTVLPATATSGKRAKVTFRVVEQLSPEVSVQLQVENAAGDPLYQTTSGWFKKRPKNSWSFTCRLPPGTYDLLIAGKDLAGNLGAAGQAKLTVK